VRIAAVSAMGLTVLGTGLASAPAAAQVRELRWDRVADPVVLGVGAAAWLTSELLKSSLVPSTCRWCDADALDLDARHALVWPSTSAADVASSVIAFGLAPASAALTLGLAANHDRAFAHDIVGDVVIVGEATVLAIDLDQLTKFIVARERPFAYELGSGERAHAASPDDDLSFFSGHTTATFALAAAAGTVATMRAYRWAPLTWIAGGALAATTGYLRIAADKHWLTDVMTGMVVGTAVGILVPLVFHSPRTQGNTGAGTPLPPAPLAASFAFGW
jgi:membrane-associated phospholipid phosphatase